MEDLFTQFYAGGALLVMWGALLCNWLLPFPREAHPALLWHKFAEQLAEKVNTRASYSQSLISGTLAWGLMILPTLAVLIALKPLVWQPALFELAFLLLAIEWRNTQRFGRLFVEALARNDKEQARLLIRPYLNRETRPLSLLGLGKAGVETLTMSYGRNLIGVLFWYGISGATGAFLYRMCVELARAWSPSREYFHPFGLPAVRVVAILDWLPLRLYSLFILLGQRSRATYLLLREQARQWPLPGPAWLLVSVGAKLELSMGGPAIYPTDAKHQASKKRIRAKLGGRIAPSAIHVAQVLTLLNQRLLVWFVVQSLLMAMIYQGF